MTAECCLGPDATTGPPCETARGRASGRPPTTPGVRATHEAVNRHLPVVTDAPAPAPAAPVEPEAPAPSPADPHALTADAIDAMDMDEAIALFARLEGRKPHHAIKLETLRDKLKEIALT